MSEQTMRRLHRAMGEVLDLLDGVPEAHDAAWASWRLGHTVHEDSGTGIHGSLHGASRETAERIAGLLVGRVERTDSLTYTTPQLRRHDICATHRGIAVRVTVWLPEPTEREALLARLAELDAAEDESGGDGGE